MKNPKTAAISVRLDQDLKERLVTTAKNLDLSENDIARHAIRAAVAAIEANNYRVELPLSMAVKKGEPVTVRGPRGGLAAIERLGQPASGTSLTPSPRPLRKK
ncbi:MAG: hypothetical protein ABMA13_23085 [Chthoniobacteraceae bacterium]